MTSDSYDHECHYTTRHAYSAKCFNRSDNSVGREKAWYCNEGSLSNLPEKAAASQKDEAEFVQLLREIAAEISKKTEPHRHMPGIRELH